MTDTEKFTSDESSSRRQPEDDPMLENRLSSPDHRNRDPRERSPSRRPKRSRRGTPGFQSSTYRPNYEQLPERPWYGDAWWEPRYDREWRLGYYESDFRLRNERRFPYEPDPHSRSPSRSLLYEAPRYRERVHEPAFYPERRRHEPYPYGPYEVPPPRREYYGYGQPGLFRDYDSPRDYPPRRKYDQPEFYDRYEAEPRSHDTPAPREQSPLQ